MTTPEIIAENETARFAETTEKIKEIKSAVRRFGDHNAVGRALTDETDRNGGNPYVLQANEAKKSMNHCKKCGNNIPDFASDCAGAGFGDCCGKTL
jgi:hypothetical protein